MQNEQLPQERVESEPKRLKYRSPSVARLGKLADMTLSVTGTSTVNDGGMATKPMS